MAETSQHIVKISADLSQLQQSFTKIDSSTKSLANSIKSTLGTAFGAYLGVQTARQIITLADNMKLLESRIALVSSSQAEYNSTMRELFNISQKTGATLQDTAAFYAKIKLFTDDANVSNEKFLQLTENINKAVQLSGANTQQAAAATLQFSQAIASNNLAGDEFKSLLENSTYVLKALAKAMNVDGVGALRQMTKDAAITREEMFKLADPAITAQIEADYSKLGDTVEKSLNRLSNSFAFVVSKSNEATDSTGVIAETINDIAEGITGSADVIAKGWKNIVDVITGSVNLLAGAFVGFQYAIGKIDKDVYVEALSEINTRMHKLDETTVKTNKTFDYMAGKGGGGLKKASSEAESLTKTLEKLKDSIDLKTEEKLRENLNQPLDDADKILLDLEKDLKRNKKAFEELGESGKKQLDAIKNSAAKLKEQLQFEKNMKFMEFAEGEIREQEEKLREAAMEPFLNAVRGIQDAFADLFTNIFENGVDSFGDLAAQLKKVMFTVIGQIAAAMVFKPVVGSVVGGLASSGIISAATAGTVKEGLGLSSGGGIKDLFSGASSAYSLVSGSTTTALTGMGMPAGLAGGLGVALPAIGIAAAIAGIAGMFGGKKKHPAGGFYAQLDEEGKYTNFELKSKHIDPEAVQSLADNLSPLFQQLVAASINLEGTQVRAKMVGKDGRASFGIQTGLGATESIKWLEEFDPSKAEELDKAMTKFIVELSNTAEVTNNDVVEALKNLQTEGKSLAEVMDEINFAASKESLRQALSSSLATDLSKYFDPSLSEIGSENSRYKQQLDFANKIGGDVNMVEKLHAANLEAIRQKYAQIAVTTDGATQSTMSLNEALSDASSRFQAFSKIVESLADFSVSLKLGALSPMSAAQKYALAKSTFEQTSAMAKLGNVDAMNNLPSVGQQFLSISREFNAGSAAYTEDFNNVVAATDAARAVAERQRDIAQGQYDLLSAQLAETQKQTDLLGQLVDAKNPKGFSYGAAYISNLSNPASLINTKIGETTDSVSKMNWGAASGLEVRALARALGYTGEFGTGGLDALLQGDSSFKELFNTALYAIGGTPKFRAGGGAVSPNFPYVVGESGREMFVPNTQGRIMSSNETSAFLSSMSGSNESAVVRAVKDLTSAVISTNNRVEALQKQVNNSSLYRRAG